MIICKICKKEFKTKPGLSSHLKQIHENKMSIIEYYDKYYLIENGNICHNKNCHNKTNFISLSIGYHKYCSRKCSNQSEQTKEKAKKTYFNHYNVSHSLKSKIVREQIKKTNLEKYGVENVSQNKEIKEQIKKTNLEKYGVEYILQLDKIREKSKKIWIEKYGTDNPMKNKIIQEKGRKTFKKRTGFDHQSQDPMIQEKMKESKYYNFFKRLLCSTRLKTLSKPCFTIDDYQGVKYYYEWECTKCNNKFKETLKNGNIPKCPSCFPIIKSSSKSEQEIYEYCLNQFNNIMRNKRKYLNGKEIDIYIPELKLGIEFNGLYWHSELGGDKLQKYHLDKTINAKNKDIQLIHIFEDEWLDKQEIVKSILLSKMGKIENKIYGRKCIIKEVNKEIALTFLFDSHLQGPINGKHFGLFYNNELVALLIMGKSRFNKNYEWEILRYCNKLNTTVVGGFSKLLKYFKKIYKPSSIITYADARYSTGDLYNKSEFKFIGMSKPNYYYMKISNGRRIRESRIKYQKHKLPNLLENFDPNLTEWENMQLNGYDRIWDCGNYVYEWRR